MFDRKYNVFRIVAQNRSFTLASKELFVTQPAVSKMITDLEKELDIKLINRKKYGDFLTEDGKILYEYLEEAVSRNQNILRLLKNRKKLLRIGTTKTIGSYYIVDRIGEIKKSQEDLSIHMIVENTEAILKKLSTDQIDIAIVEGDTDTSNYYSCELCEDSLKLFCSKYNSLKDKNSVVFSDIITNNLIMREKGSGTRESIYKSFRNKGIEIVDSDIFMEISDIEGIKKLVKNNFGVAFLSKLMIYKEEKEDIVMVKNFDMSCKRHFTMIWKNKDFEKFSSFLKYNKK